MTNNDELKYYEQRIWEFKDVPISDNNLNVSVLFTDSQWGISPARLKFQIANYKRKTFEWMHFTHKDTMLYLSKADNGMSVVQENKQSILNGDTQKGFTCKCDKNITIKTVFLTKSEYGGELCVRLALSEKETGYLDSEVIYLPYIDYLSLITIFKNFRDNYLTISNNVFIGVILDKIYSKMDSLNGKFNEHLSILDGIRFNNDKKIEDEILKETPKIIDTIELKNTDIKIEEPIKEESKPVVEKIQLTPEIPKELSDFTEFVKENKDKVDISFVSNTAKSALDEINKGSTITVKLNEELFTSKMLCGDLSKLEQIVINSISTDIPLLSILKVFVKEIGKNESDIKSIFFPNINDREFNAILYLSTRYLKIVLNTHLSKKQPLQDRVFPFFANIDTSNKFVSKNPIEESCI